MNEKVSVIIPVYKVEKYLDRCVESVVNQTYKNLEIILVDDGSPDNCPQMCEVWANKDARIKAIHKENAGLGMARNSGLETATGEYLMFVDSDDYLSENAVEVLYERMAVDGSDMAVGKHVDVYDDGRINDSFCRWMEDEIVTSKDVFLAIEKHYYPVSACGKLYKKEVFDNCFFPRLMCGEDLWTFPQVVNKCNLISVVNKDLYYYYQRADSIVHQRNYVRRRDEIEANLNFASFLLHKEYYSAAAKWFERTVHFLCELQNSKEARKLISKYFSQHECKMIYVLLPLKAKVKWHSLYVPGAYSVISIIRRTRGITQ